MDNKCHFPFRSRHRNDTILLSMKSAIKRPALKLLAPVDLPNCRCCPNVRKLASNSCQRQPGVSLLCKEARFYLPGHLTVICVRACARARARVCVCVYVCEWMLVGFRYRVSDIYRPAMLAAHTFHHDGGHESSKLTKMDFHLEGIN